MNYIKINTTNISKNLNTLKNKYKYQYYILDVSNNAYKHGMYLLNYIEGFSYLYVNNIKEAYLIREFNKEIPVILNSFITKDNILDLINNDIILVINSLEELKQIQDLYANLKIILNIDIDGLKGFNNKFTITDALIIINNTKNLELIGIISSNIKEKDYENFLYITNDLLNLNLKLYIFNNEKDKNKIKNSNAIVLDNSIYGINIKKKLFQKDSPKYKQVFSLYTNIENIKKETKGHKNIYYGIIPLGYLNGLEKIKKVIINGIYYTIDEVFKDYSTIIIDDNIKRNDSVIITNDLNPIEDFLDDNPLSYLNILSNNIPITYNNDILEKLYN